jgi:hypothetical protein
MTRNNRGQTTVLPSTVWVIEIVGDIWGQSKNWSIKGARIEGIGIFYPV